MTTLFGLFVVAIFQLALGCRIGCNHLCLWYYYGSHRWHSFLRTFVLVNI